MKLLGLGGSRCGGADQFQPAHLAACRNRRKFSESPFSGGGAANRSLSAM
jgi:hypothetical protein